MLPSSTDNVSSSSDTPETGVQSVPTQIQSPEICVICLDRISEKATALPCRHDQFDFPCLGTWIQEQRICPLCKSVVTALQYGHEDESKPPKVFELPPQTDKAERQDRRSYGQGRRQVRGRGQPPNRYRPYGNVGRVNRREQNQQPSQLPKDAALEMRCYVYRHQMYSLHVGTNRISKYRNITPSTFHTNAQLVTRAKAFVRRELAVFDFLNPSSPSFGRTDRRASNAEFLLEYIISILKSVDLKASTGQAEALLTDFLGRGNARLFLHELEAWLRSPYERLADWDHHVQYEQVVQHESTREHT